MKPRLFIVIPCYNEEKVLPLTLPLFREELQKMIRKGQIAETSRLLFVNDGSQDHTWNLIQDAASKYVEVEGISLSRNRGHQNALLSGLMEASRVSDITISIDCDGQEDVSAMEEMVEAYLDGSDIVYGIRKNRNTDTWFKRTSAQVFYKFLRSMGAEVIYNHADYRLVSSRAMKAFSNFSEVNLYLRGMFPLVGFKSTCVYYENRERMAGKSHYSLSNMLDLAMNGLTSLSIKPLHLISGFGLGLSFLSFLMMLWVLFSYIRGQEVSGWLFGVLVASLLGGIQLISLGVIGEYVGKIYMETKHRPRYIIAERTEGLVEGRKTDEDQGR